MKKLLLLSVILAATLHVRGQITSSQIVKFKKPRHSQAMDSIEFGAYAKAHFLRPEAVALKNKRRDYYGKFKLDSILIAVWDMFDHSSGENHQAIVNDRLWYYQMNRFVTLNYIKTVTVNNVMFVVDQGQKDDEFYLSFTSDEINKKAVGGCIAYKKQYENKAQQLLTELLTSMRFKK